jgi:uncharacterized protein (TIGR00299 family) protein
MYLDCFSGAAGDMLLAACLDAGLPLDALTAALGSLGVDHALDVTRVLRSGLSATHLQVRERSDGGAPQGHHHPHQHEHEHQHNHAHDHRSLKEIAHLIGHSSLSASGKARATALFRRLAEAEAAIHNMSVDDVHLHEVGATDSIIDIVGAVFAFEWFGIDDIVASPLNVGAGSVEIAHGRFPVPAPATVRLLTGAPIYSSGVQAELVTPTGALLVTDYARSFGPMPSMAIERVGYGAGTMDLGSAPNVLRLFIGERTEVAKAPTSGESIVKIECEIDDMNPQLFGPVSDRLFADGALDVFLTAVQMKKGRPGTLLTVLSPELKRDVLIERLFRETTTLGVRFEPMSREILERRWVEVALDGGTVRIKVSSRRGETLNAVPEFDDCLRVATSTGRPVKDIQADALKAWFQT